MAPSEQENWQKSFEMIGPATLRLRLEHRRSEYSGEYGRCAEQWLLDKEAEAATTERERFSVIHRMPRRRELRSGEDNDKFAPTTISGPAK